MCHFVYRVVLYFSVCCGTLLGFQVGLFLLKLNFIASNLISLKGVINIKMAVFSLMCGYVILSSLQRLRCKRQGRSLSISSC